MKAFILIGAAVLLVVVGIILRAGATEWAMVPVRGVSNQLTLDSEKESMIRDTGNAFALFGVICFTAGVYGWMSYRVKLP